jgi:hypothetical protein
MLTRSSRRRRQHQPTPTPAPTPIEPPVDVDPIVPTPTPTPAPTPIEPPVDIELSVTEEKFVDLWVTEDTQIDKSEDDSHISDVVSENEVINIWDVKREIDPLWEELGLVGASPSPSSNRAPKPLILVRVLLRVSLSATPMVMRLPNTFSLTTTPAALAVISP